MRLNVIAHIASLSTSPHLVSSAANQSGNDLSNVDHIGAISDQNLIGLGHEARANSAIGFVRFGQKYSIRLDDHGSS